MIGVGRGAEDNRRSQSTESTKQASQVLRETEAETRHPHGSALMLWNFYLGIFVGLRTMGAGFSKIFSYALGKLFLLLVCLTSLDMRVYV